MTHVKRSILVIDDDSLVQYTLGEVLANQGYAVTSAEDGRSGLASFHEHRPDLVIADIFMPEMDGLETIRKIRAIGSAQPIIAISGCSRMEGMDFLPMAKCIGATATLRKPFDTQDLLTKNE